MTVAKSLIYALPALLRDWAGIKVLGVLQGVSDTRGGRGSHRLGNIRFGEYMRQATADWSVHPAREKKFPWRQRNRGARPWSLGQSGQFR